MRTVPRTITMKTAARLTILLGLALALACRDSTGPTDRPLPELAIHPSSGAPGEEITVTGVDAADLDPATTRLFLGDSPAPVLLGEDGELIARVPLFVDEQTGPYIPDAPVDVRVEVGDEPIAALAAGFTVVAPPPSPGTLDAALSDLASVREVFAVLADAFVDQATVADVAMAAAAAALDDALFGDHPDSFQSTLDELAAEGDEAYELAEALLAATGLADALAFYADGLAALAEALADEEDAGASEAGPIVAASGARGARTAADELCSLCVHSPTDVQLARWMQRAEMLRDFAELVIGQTVSQFGSIATGGSIYKALPTDTPDEPGTRRARAVAGLVGKISAVLTILDFAANRVVVGFLPTEIDHFALIVEDAVIGPGERADAMVELHAINDPPAITLQAVIGQVLNALGMAASSPAAASWSQAITPLLNVFLGQLRSYLADALEEDVELFSIVPDMRWETVIEDPRLVERLSHTPEIIDGVEYAVEWIASLETFGDGRIFTRTMQGPESHLISPPLGIVYEGGAFGNDVRESNEAEVRVRADLFIETDLHPVIDPAGMNGLTIRGGYLVEGAPLWRGGFTVTLETQGGSVDDATGVTDEGGFFQTLVRIDEGSDSVVVHITLSDAHGETASATAVSRTEAEIGHVRIRGRTIHTYVEASARSNDDDRITDEDVESVIENLVDHPIGTVEPVNHALGESVSRSSSDGSASASASVSNRMDGFPVELTGGVLTISGAGSFDASGMATGTEDRPPGHRRPSGGARVIAITQVTFEALDGAFRIDAEADVTKSGSATGMHDSGTGGGSNAIASMFRLGRFAGGSCGSHFVGVSTLWYDFVGGEQHETWPEPVNHSVVIEPGNVYCIYMELNYIGGGTQPTAADAETNSANAEASYEWTLTLTPVAAVATETP